MGAARPGGLEGAAAATLQNGSWHTSQLGTGRPCPCGPPPFWLGPWRYRVLLAYAPRAKHGILR
eukprot:15449058-Alexandrium_andersonii.AAC.1